MNRYVKRLMYMVGLTPVFIVGLFVVYAFVIEFRKFGMTYPSVAAIAWIAAATILAYMYASKKTAD